MSRLECTVCRTAFDLQPLLFGCPQCRARGVRAPLEVRYELERLNLPLPAARSGRGIWRWHALLPGFRETSIATLDEGHTGLPALASRGVNRILLKNETTNPTWSWKDRAMSVSVSAAREMGFRRIAAVSTGNHGVAASAYAASAGMECTVFCHPEAPPMQMALMRFYGARVFRGGNRERMLTRLVETNECFPASIYCPRDGCANPFGVEGFKTIAFEIFEQFGGVPDSVFVPTGSGDGFFGICKGFRDLHEVGAIDRMPRMFLCQAAAVAPYVRAFRTGGPLDAVNPAPTAALSIAEPIGGLHAFLALRRAQGYAVEASEEEIQAAVRLAGSQGFAIEAASAAALACAFRAGEEAGESRVVIASGAAIKWPRGIIRNFVEPPVLPPDCEDIAR